MTAKVRIIIGFCLMAMLLFTWTGAAAALPSDIQGHWAQQEISTCVSQGLSSGYPDGTFKPDNPITRAEFFTLINRAFGLTDMASPTFGDISTTDWFYNEIAKAIAAGYISGYEDNTIRPDNAIVRQEVAAILAKLQGLGNADETALQSYKDNDAIGAWAKTSVAAVVGSGLMKGYPDQTFSPLNPLTRAEALASLQRARDRLEDSRGEDRRGRKDKTPPRIKSAVIYISNKPYTVNISHKGLQGNINLSKIKDSANINRGLINVSEDAILHLQTTIPILNLPVEVDQELKAGSNKLKLFDVLSMVGPDGVYMSTLRKYLGNLATYTGTLTDAAGNVSTVSITIKM
ncbi:MAG: Cellulosome-anchoring protein precursor [Pelotomaculum sp. PtaB.Bin104]|nr:MAG: Cellulosome-anchoring protein precursor [Pelotomaculum sp. PtaB.Bin104]